MPGSAVLGQPPNNDDDLYIVTALLRLFHSDRDPAKGISFGPPPPNIHDNSRGPRVLAGCIIAIILSTLITGSRLLIRALHQQVKWGWDDWFIIPAAIFAIAWFATTITVVVAGGGGRHIYYLTYHEYNVYREMATIGLLLFIPASVFVKVSIALFVRRITGISSRAWSRVNNVFLMILFVELVGFTVTNIVKCKPFAGAFDLIAAGKATVPMKCNDVVKAGKTRVYFNVILDFALLTTPIIVLWKVQVPIEKKARVIALFGLGIIPCVASIMTVIIGTKLTSDHTYEFPNLSSWITIELLFGLVVASAPTLHSYLPRSWRIMSSAVKNQLSTHTDKNRSHRIPDKPLGRHETLESGKIHRQDDIELAYSARPVSISDGESGKRGLLEDQHPWVDHSVHFPDRTYQHATNVTGMAATTDSTLQSFHLGKEHE